MLFRENLYFLSGGFGMAEEAVDRVEALSFSELRLLAPLYAFDVCRGGGDVERGRAAGVTKAEVVSLRSVNSSKRSTRSSDSSLLCESITISSPFLTMRLLPELCVDRGNVVSEEGG